MEWGFIYLFLFAGKGSFCLQNEIPKHGRQTRSSMANTKTAEGLLMLLARNCEQEMEDKIAVLVLGVEKLKTLRKDSTEERLVLVKIMGDHEKYIVMLKQAHEDAIKNVLPVVANMDEGEYTGGSWKVEDSYGCNCSEWNYEHGCKGKGHFGSYHQDYIFTPLDRERRNVDK